jgi:hypothetical protein
MTVPAKLRPSKTIALKRIFWSLGVGLALLIFYSPQLYSLGWHVRNGSLLAYQDQNIPVPISWIAKSRPERLTLKRLPLTIFGLLHFEWMTRGISIRKNIVQYRTPSESEESFEKSFWTYPPGPDNSVVSGPIRLGVPPHDSFCMRSTPPDKEAPLIVECLWKQGTWSGDAIGDQRAVDTLFSILRRIN